MTTQEIADQLAEIGAHLEADGKDREAIAYSNAADTLQTRETIPPDPSELDGIGETIRDNIMEYQRTGSIEKLDELKEEYPYLEELRQVDGVGPKTATKLNDELGISHVGELIDREDELPAAHRVGEKTAANLAEAAQDHIDGVTERKPLEEAGAVFATVIDAFFDEFEADVIVDGKSKKLPFTLLPAGSYRRREDTVGDLDILVLRDYEDDIPPEVTPTIQEIQDALAAQNDRVLSRGTEKMSVIVDGMQVDTRFVEARSFGAAMLYFTGPKTYNIEMRRIAQEQGYKLNEYGLYDTETAERVAGASEHDVCEAIGIEYDEPWERSRNGIQRI